MDLSDSDSNSNSNKSNASSAVKVASYEFCLPKHNTSYFHTWKVKHEESSQNVSFCFRSVKHGRKGNTCCLKGQTWVSSSET